MGRNAMKECETCQKSIRSDVMARHMRSHEVLKVRLEIRKEKEVKVKGLRKQLQQVIGKENLEQMYHMYYRVDCFQPGKTAEDVESHFDITHNLACSCGATRDCTHPHTHLLGTWKGINEANKSRSFQQYFAEQKAYSCKSIGPYKTLEDKISSIKHFIHTACYIQTQRGWHKKTAQRNPYVFGDLEQNKKFLLETYKEWMWAQVSYMRYLQKQMDDLIRKIEFATTEERKAKLRHTLCKLDEKMIDLEKTWGEEHNYTDEEIEADLELFLTECKEIGNSETA